MQVLKLPCLPYSLMQHVCEIWQTHTINHAKRTGDERGPFVQRDISFLSEDSTLDSLSFLAHNYLDLTDGGSPSLPPPSSPPSGSPDDRGGMSKTKKST